MKQVKILLITLLLMAFSVATFATVGPITGIMTVCAGTTTTLGDTTAGGTWSSSNTAIATVDTAGSVTGLAAGTVTISYTAGTTVIATVTVNASPSAISGLNTVCTGSALTLTDATSGGSWSSSNPVIATVTGGTVVGLTPGVVNISYSLSFGCTVSTSVTVNVLPAAIAGIASLCNGLSTTLTDVTPGGTWSTSATGLAVGSLTGVVTGISTGTGNISYTLASGCFVQRTIAVLPSPTAITGPGSICASGTGTLGNAVTGGMWTSSSVTVATIGSASGVVTGIYAGTATISYTLSSGCSTSSTITVNPTPAAISGPTGVCIGSLSTLTELTTGGVWTSSSPAIGTISASGDVTGLAAGTTNINYTIGTTGCMTTTVVTVYATPSAIGGTTSICSGNLVTLTNAATGGVWSSSNTAIATINATSGTITGVTAGTATITYALGTGCTVTTLLTVNGSPAIYSTTGGGNYCAGSVGVPVGLSGSSSGNTYQLFVGPTAVGAPLTGFGGPLSFGYQAAPGAYSVLAYNTSNGCSRSMTGSPVVSINSLPVTYGVTGGGAYCAGSAGPHIGLANSQTATTYQLYNGGIVAGTPINGVGGAIDFGSHSAVGTYQVIATSMTNSCSNTMGGTANIVSNPLPTTYTVTGGGGYCAGGAGLHVYLSGSQSGITYQLYKSSTFTGIQLLGTGSSLDFGSQTAAGPYVIIATDGSTGCSVYMAGSATIAINPLPQVFTVTSTPLTGGYCSGGSGVHINLSGSNLGVTYQLYHGGSPVGAPVSGSGSALDFGLQTAIGTYTAVATNATTTCIVSMAGSGSVNIYPLPTAFTVTGGGSYCGGGSGVPVGLDGSTNGIIYQLYNGTTPVGSPIMGTGLAVSFGLKTLAGSYAVVATNPGTSCSNNMLASATVSIITPVVPSVTLNVSPSDTVCAGTTVVFTANPINGGTSPLYNWYKNGIVVSSSGATFSSTPLNGDLIKVIMASSATCVTSATVEDTVTMNVINVPAILGTPSTCLGGSTSLSDTLAGGIWTTEDPAIAIISTVGGTTGVVTGISVGTVAMTYTIGSGCYSVVTVTVGALPSVTVSAIPAACGGSYSLNATGGSSYSWLPSSGLSCATCANTITNPSVTTTYTVTASSIAGCTGTGTVTVNGNRISGYISYTGSSPDVFRVWLIQLNTTDSSLIAVDSTLSCMVSGTPYYEFAGKPAGNYMVKARLLGTVPGTSGYIPTYSLSSPYWSAAATVNHTSATDTMHINMVFGTVPPGPGFIGGLISSGAGKGTAGDVASKGMIVYLLDAVTNYVLTYTYTDNSGHYSFSNIADGNYIVYPEYYTYHTIPSSVIMLGSGSDSSAINNFRQFNTSRVIKPSGSSGVDEVRDFTGTSNQFLVFPNPASDKLSLLWSDSDFGIASVTVYNVSGQSALNTSVNIDELRNSSPNNTALTHVDLTGFPKGIYILTAKGSGVNHTQKIVIR